MHPPVIYHVRLAEQSHEYAAKVHIYHRLRSRTSASNIHAPRYFVARGRCLFIGGEETFT